MTAFADSINSPSTFAMTHDPHALTRALLVAELDAPRFLHAGYLEWFYADNPRGAAMQENEDDPDTGRRVGHYGILPALFRHGNETLPFIFSSNVATDSTARRSGLFRQMANRMYERAAATGAPAMVGVGNDASTVVVVERFGWHKIAPMRAKLTWGFPRRDVRRIPITTEFLASAEFAELTNDLGDVPVHDWAQAWDTDFLRWRLARPDGGYVLHVAPHALAISVGTHGPLRIPFAVLLKVWPRSAAHTPVNAGSIVASATIAHHAIGCVYAGWNASVVVRGITVPHRLQPSPLNVVLKVLDPTRISAETFHLETWELLDMDAY